MKRLKFDKHFIPKDEDFKRDITYYSVTCKGVVLGMITNEHWSRFTWSQESDCIMSRGCLKEVVEFMDSLGGKP